MLVGELRYCRLLFGLRLLFGRVDLPSDPDGSFPRFPSDRVAVVDGRDARCVASGGGKA
jgi:hypothetical protein